LGKAETLTITGGHIDVLPTLLCLLGLENTQTVMFGQNLLEAESGIVCEQTHLSVGSFISDEVMFCKPHNNIEANFSVYEKGTMARLSPWEYTQISEYAEKRIRDCESLLINNDIFLDNAVKH
jgi:phosphoglycerol transferase MdoB-like AlkP superfamily enzyme